MLCLLSFFSVDEVFAQATIDYTPGATDNTTYSTTAPNNPTTLNLVSGAAEQAGALTGSGSVIKTGAGTLTLSGANTYTGGTTINSGKLIGAAGSGFGSGQVTVGAGVLEIESGLTLSNRIFLQTGGEVINGGTISRLTTGQEGIQSAAAGGVPYKVTNLSTGVIESASTGVLLQQGGTVINDGGTIRSVNGAGISFSNGVGHVTNQAGATLQGFQGLAMLHGGTLTNSASLIWGVTNDGISAGAVVGSFTSITNSDGATIRGQRYGISIVTNGEVTNDASLIEGVTAGIAGGHLEIKNLNGGEIKGGSYGISLTMGGSVLNEGTIEGGINITGAAGEVENSGAIVGSVVLGNFANEVTLVAGGQIQGDLDLSSNGGAKLILSGDGTQSYSGAVTGATTFAGILQKEGAGTWTVDTNLGAAGVEINQGILSTQGASVLGSGPIDLNSGGTLNPVTSLTVQSLNWADGGTISLALGSGTEVFVTGGMTMTGTGYFSFTDGGFVGNVEYDLITFDTLSSTPTAWMANLMGPLGGTFRLQDNLDGTTTLKVAYYGAVSGPVINNFAPHFTPMNLEFQLIGEVRALPGPQQVASLLADDGSSLVIEESLNLSNGTVNTPNGTARISGGVLTSPGDWSKLGNGTLIVGSNLISGDDLLVKGGSLYLNGRAEARNIMVDPGALLGGSGTLFGNVFNHGTVSPGNSPGTLSVNGNFTQSSGGTLAIEIASASVFDRLVVSGTAALAGRLTVSEWAGYSLQFGQQFDFLEANSITGEFDQIVMPDGYRGRFLEEDGTGTLLVAPESYVQVAATPNQRRVASALNSFIGRDGDADEVSFALDLLDEGAYGQAFEQIAPGFYETLGEISVEQALAQNQLVAQRMSMARSGDAVFTVIGLDQAALKNDLDGKSVAEAKDAKQVDVEKPQGDMRVWILGNGNFARVTNVSQVPNYRFDSGGFLVGADYHLGESLIVGLYGGYQGTYARYSGGSTTEVNSVVFGGYATYSVGGFYTDLIVSGGYSDYQVRRSIDFSTIDRMARSNPDGGQFSTYLDLGYDWNIGGFSFGPLISAEYAFVGISDLQERNASSLNLEVSEQTINSLRTNLGGRIAYTWTLSSEISVIPEIRIFWQHEYMDDSQTIGAELEGGGGGFEFATSAPGRDSVFAGVGVGAYFGDHFSSSVFYNANFGRQDFVSHMISLGLGWKF